MKKRIISFVLAICLLVSMVPAMAVKSLAVSNVNYDEFKITFEQLFSSYPEYLSPESEAYITSELSDDYIDAIKRHEGESVEVQKAMDALCNKGILEFVVDGALSELGLGKDEEQELLWETILLLMNNIFKDKTILAVICEKLGLSFDFVTTTIDLSKKVEKKAFIAHLKMQFSYLPPEEVEEVAEYIIKHKDKILKIVDEDKISNANDTASDMKKLCDIIQSMFLLYSLERESLDLLLDAVPPDSSFADAIRMVKKNMNKNLPKYVLDTYGHDAVVKGIIAMLKAVPELGVSLEVADKIWNCVNIAADVIRQEYLGYATYTDMKRTLILSGYVGDLRAAVIREREEFVARVNAGSTIGLDEIEDYEFIYGTYISALRTAIDSAKRLVPSGYAPALDSSIKLCDKLTFAKYLRLCMAALRADIDAGIIAPPSSLHGDPNACIAATYPASGTLTVTKENANIMDRPCSVNTDVNAQLIESGALNAKYTVTGSCVNTANNTWYIITTKSGQTGYIYSGNCTYVGASDATITGLDMPSSLEVGKRYWIKGTISAQNSTIVSVSCYVYDASGKQRTGGTANVNGKSYDLYRSDVDTLTEFNILGAGTYTWKISANVDVGNACQEVVLGSGTLVVGTQTEGGNSGNNVGGSILRAEGAEFISRSDGVWLWPLPASNYAINDWAGCTGNNPCYFHPNSIPGCIPAHDDEGRFGHNGIDLAAYYTDVYATASGYLYCTNTDWPSRGKTAIVEHPAGTDANGVSWSYYSIYQHLDSAETSRNGQWVEAGMRIAVSGATDGYGTGAFHLHFGIVMGQSGQGSSFAQNPNGALYNLENQGWLTTPGYGNGRILCNPALNSPAGTPAYNYGCEATTRGHAGSVLYTLNKSEVAIGEASSRPCSHNYTESVTKAATCTTEGTRKKTCTLCNDTITETIPALGHDYQETVVAPTCGSYGYTLRTCSRCDFSETTVPSEEDWSEWQEEKPSGMAEGLIESGVQYCFREKAVETGTVNYVSAWPAGFDKNHSLYAKYNNIPVSDSETDSHRTTVTSNQTIGYLYYHWCRGAVTNGPINRRVNSVYTGEYRAFHAFYSTEGAGEFDANGNYGEGTYYYPNAGCCADTYWYYQIPVNQQTYITENKNAEDGWGKWSDWSFEEVMETNIREVNKRTVYRYYVGSLPEHSWKNDTCAVCGIHNPDYEEPTNPEKHEHSYTSKVTAPTCTEKGYTTYTCACGESYKDDYAKAKGHNYVDGICTRCGEDDPDYTEPEKPTKPEETGSVVRLTGGNRFETAFAVADALKEKLGVEKFDTIIVTYGANFPDALSGSYLAAVKNAPILLSFNKKYDDMAMDYIRENLRSGGTVYLLGEKNVVSARFEENLSGYNVKRLAGANRFETNLEVLKEAGVGDKPILVCTGLSFADSLSASAAEMPILLVWNNLTDGQKAFLDSLDGNKLYVIGGESAVSATMAGQLTRYGEVARVAGKNRFETSVAIAETFFDNPDSAVLAYAWNFPDGLCGGALAATMDAPLILTMTKYEARAAEYIQDKTIKNGFILGGETLISSDTVNSIFN